MGDDPNLVVTRVSHASTIVKGVGDAFYVSQSKRSSCSVHRELSLNYPGSAFVGTRRAHRRWVACLKLKFQNPQTPLLIRMFGFLCTLTSHPFDGSYEVRFYHTVNG